MTMIELGVFLLEIKWRKKKNGLETEVNEWIGDVARSNQ